MRIIILLAALFLPSATLANTEIIEKDWGKYTIEWSNGSQMITRYAIFDEDGLVKVCAGVTHRRGVPHQLIKVALESAYLEYSGGVNIIHDLSFGKIYSSRFATTQLVLEKANCINTNAPALKAPVRLVFPDKEYTYDK